MSKVSGRNRLTERLCKKPGEDGPTWLTRGMGNRKINSGVTGLDTDCFKILILLLYAMFLLLKQYLVLEKAAWSLCIYHWSQLPKFRTADNEPMLGLLK